MGEIVSLAEAVRRLGLNERTIRRHIKEGRLTGQQVHTPRGFRWMIELPDGNTSTRRHSYRSGRRPIAAVRPDKPAIPEPPVSRALIVEGNALSSLEGAIREQTALLQKLLDLQMQGPLPQVPAPTPRESLGGRLARVLSDWLRSPARHK